MKRPLIAIALVAVLIAIIRIHFTSPSEAGELLKKEESLNALVEGRVESVTDGDGYFRYIVKDARISNKESKLQAGKISLYINSDNRKVNESEGCLDICAGDVVSFKGKVYLPKKPSNEGGFDEKHYFKSNGLELAASADEIHLEKKTGSALFKFTERLKKAFNLSFDNISPEHKELVNAIIIGDLTGLSGEVKSRYRDAGIGHLLAISGLHVSIAGLLVFNISRSCGLAKSRAGPISYFFLFIYIIMTGSGPPAVRAGVMLGFYIMSKILGRPYCPYSALAFEVAVVLSFYPYFIINQSFILSHLAIISILAAGELKKVIISENLKNKFAKRRILRAVLSNIWSSCFLAVSLMPLQCLFFYKISIYSVAVNILVIPLTQILIPLFFLAGIVGMFFVAGGVFLAGGGNVILTFYDFLCDLSLKLPASQLTTGKPSVYAVAIFYIAFFGLIFCYVKIKKDFIHYGIRGRFGRFDKVGGRFLIGWGLLVFAAHIFVGLPQRPPQNTVFTMLDVGQGDCGIIRNKQGKVIMSDCGSTSRKNVYANVLKPYLTYRGIRRLDAIFISHTDEDHVNGVIDLLKEGQRSGIKVGSIFLPGIAEEAKNDYYREVELLSKQLGVNLCYVGEDDIIKDRTFKISVVSPAVSKKSKSTAKVDLNYSSICFYYEEDEGSIFFTGDATTETEENLLKKRQIKETDILKVGHHGSKGSSSETFLKKISPRISIISCGVNNRYGHPAKETLDRLKKTDTEVLITTGGQVDVYLDPALRKM